MNTKEHWEKVYENKSPAEVSWTQERPEVSLQLIEEAKLPKNAKIFGMTAGLPVTLQGLVGANGKVWGMESFGFSAPYKVLDEKLGYTGENVYKQVKAFLAEA